MHTLKLKGLAVGIILLFVGTILTPTTALETKKTPNTRIITHPVFQFPAWLSIEIEPDDWELLRQPIKPGDTLNIHFTVGYGAAIPDFLLQPPFLRIKNVIVFGRFINYPQKITMSVDNVPSWADVSFINPELYIDISNTPHYATATLVLAIGEDAPATVQSIEVTAVAPERHRIEEVQFTTMFSFAVQWIPQINISTNQTTIRTPPNTMTNVSMNVTNEGNGVTLINITTPEIEGWSIASTPQWIVLPVGFTENVLIHITPPGNFQGTQEIELLFAPYSQGGLPAPPIPFLLTAYYP